MNTLLNGFLRLIGFGKAVDALDGETSKAYLGGAIKILSGAGSVLLAAANIAVQVAAGHGGADYLAVAKGVFNGNAETAMLTGGVALIGAGIAAIGQRHAIAKAAVPDVPPSAPPLGAMKPL